MLNSSFQGVNRLLVMGFNDTDGKNGRVQRTDHKRYFLPKIDFDYNVLIDSRNFYNQNSSDKLRKYDEVRNIMSGKGEGYTTGSLLDYAYYKNHYKLIACNLQNQKVLDSDPKAIPKIEFIYKIGSINNADTTAQILTVFEKEEETILEYSKGTVKVY